MNTVFRISVKSADVHVPKRRENNTGTESVFGFVNMFLWKDLFISCR